MKRAQNSDSKSFVKKQNLTSRIEMRRKSLKHLFFRPPVAKIFILATPRLELYIISGLRNCWRCNRHPLCRSFSSYLFLSNRLLWTLLTFDSWKVFQTVNIFAEIKLICLSHCSLFFIGACLVGSHYRTQLKGAHPTYQSLFMRKKSEKRLSVIKS